MLTHTAKVQLLIDSHDDRGKGRRYTSLYALERLDDVRVGWRLVQQLGQRAGEVYEVWLDPGGPRCSCKDFVCRSKRHSGEFCKHLDSLLSAGILAPVLVPSPATVPDATLGRGAGQGNADRRRVGALAGDEQEYIPPPGPRRTDSTSGHDGRRCQEMAVDGPGRVRASEDAADAPWSLDW